MQSPFVTLFLYLRADDPYIEENAMIIEEVLRQRLEGIKNEAGVYITPPPQSMCYVLDEHNCLKGGKYDYLTKLAVKCSAKRMYPDYISAKKMKENYEGNVFSPMGCRSFLAPWKDENGNYKFEGRLTVKVEPSVKPCERVIKRCVRAESPVLLTVSVKITKQRLTTSAA